MTKPTLVTMDEAELMVRMIEAQTGIAQPYPNAQQCLATMSPFIKSGWARAARAAITYFTERVAAAEQGGSPVPAKKEITIENHPPTSRKH